MIIKPQEGFQEKFLSTEADICFGGGKAGAGKTWALLYEACRYINQVKGYGAVIFRRETPQIRNEGGLWDESESIYLPFGLRPVQSQLFRESSIGNRIKFAHLEHEKTIYNYQGSQIPYIGFDEITHFSAKQFWYLVGRNRSTCGVNPYIRATCNPDPDSWVAEFISWWIGEDGFIIKKRDGVIRYFCRDGDKFVWGDSKQEVYEKCKHVFEGLGEDIDPMDLIKSFTFIEGDIYENKKLLSMNPEYLGNLLTQDEAEKSKLYEGNRKVTVNNDCIFNETGLNDFFTNYPKTEGEKYLISDVARFGKDLATLFTYEGKHIKKIQIWTTCSLKDLTDEIENEREAEGIRMSHVLIDQDGMGGGVVDNLSGSVGFSGDGAVLEYKGVKENYKNLKTQCFYHLSMNIGGFSIDLDNVYIDGVKSHTITLKGKTYSIKEIIKKQLRAIRKKNMDRDGKKQINDKEQQKNLLGGISPDLADTLMMRMRFEIDTPIKAFLLD